MTKKEIKILTVCFLSLLVCACSDEGKDMPNQNGNPSLIFNMGASSRAIVDNTLVYLFDGGTWNFKKKVLGVNYETDKVSMTVDAGTWDIGLVTANADISTDIISPVRDQNRKDCKLWETKPVSGELPSMPELRTADLEGQVVLPNQMNTGTARLDRNVALVKVIIEDANGLLIGGTHKFELTKVPTTLSWTGGLYPNKDNPTQSSSPMKGQFTVKDHPTESGRQISDTLMFMVPAHKGSDYFNPNPTDTTTHHLNLNVDLECDGTGQFKKEDVVIPRTPKVNTILLVRLYVGGKLEVTSEILDWKDEELDGDFSQTLLHVDRASVGLAHKDTIYVNTTADDFTVSSDAAASWLSVQRIGTTNGVEITANVNTYVDNQPRDSYIEIKANNVTKKIPVTQRPDRGTISVDAKELFMSPPHPTKSLNVTSVGGNWKIIGSTLKADPSVTTGNIGTSPVNFTRKATSDDAYFSRVYGDTIVVFKNTQTLDTDTVRLSNLFIGIEDGLIEVDQPTIQPDTTSYIENVKVFGGNTRNLVIMEKPDWIHSAPATYYDPLTGIFTFVCDREPSEEERYGEMTLMHADDHDYTVKVKILQDILVRIPPFDYFVVQFNWGANDADIKVGFNKNPTSQVIDGVTYYTPAVSSFNNKWVGWSFTGTGDIIVRDRTNPNTGAVSKNVEFKYVKYNNQALLQWGQDARGGEGETAFFDAPIINDAPYPGQYGIGPNAEGMLPRILTLEVYVAWYSSPTPDLNIPLQCTIYCYEGGQMVYDGWSNFLPVPGVGETVFKEYKWFKLPSKSTYYHICDIQYDRKKHTAKVVWDQDRNYVSAPNRMQINQSTISSDLKNTYYEDLAAGKQPIHSKPEK